MKLQHTNLVCTAQNRQTPKYNILRCCLGAGFLVFLIFVLQTPLYSQRLTPTLIIHLDQLPQDEHVYLNGLDQSLVSLINSYNWVEARSQRKIPIQIDIFPGSRLDQGTYKKYDAKVAIALPSGIQLRDSRWEYKYTRDEKPHLGDPYDTFTSLIEYYIWIALGYEMDKLGVNGGSPFYEKARAIAERSPFEQRYYKGWDNRRALVKDIVQDSTFVKMRRAGFYATVGIYYADNAQVDKAVPYLSGAADIFLQVPPDKVEMKRDDHIIRWVNIDTFKDALRKTDQEELLYRVEGWQEAER